MIINSDLTLLVATIIRDTRLLAIKEVHLRQVYLFQVKIISKSILQCFCEPLVTDKIVSQKCALLYIFMYLILCSCSLYDFNNGALIVLSNRGILVNWEIICILDDWGKMAQFI